MKTIRVTRRNETRELQYKGSRVYYSPISLIGTASETYAIRRAMGVGPNGMGVDCHTRAPGDWPVQKGS